MLKQYGISEKSVLIQSLFSSLSPYSSSLSVQNSLNSLERDISQQFETLLNKVNSQKEMMTDLEARVQKVNISMCTHMVNITTCTLN